MTPFSLDSILLCGEDNSSVFNDSDCRGSSSLLQQAQSLVRLERPGDEPMCPVLSNEYIGELVEKERHHLPKCDYLKRLRNGDLDIVTRKEAIDWMFKVHTHYKFGHLCAYLSVNYLDRFLSVYDMPKDRPWMNQLLAVACLSLAAKNEETEAPLSLDLQVAEARFVFDAKTIKRMELVVLHNLNWRMQSVSPFAYIDHFLWKISGNSIPPRSLMSKSVQVILNSLGGIEMLEFRPSEVAAAAAVCVTAEAEFVQIEEAVSKLTQHVQKERILNCMELINELKLIGVSAKRVANFSSGTSMQPQSPIGVIEAACLSCNSPQNNTSESNKRRKIEASSSRQV
ncbi:hypothetical protein SAY87_000675 [Trapa incisa]|uniref:Cyclin N-terminal domain-containing protein n=1 Tax=Trapa incisa TaxID=236973 RepID=A0AAN7JGD4_9MYRT|nr:hypothetical protein SAY87_000675 [Trapa incisa]